MEIAKDGRRVKLGSFQSTISIWSLSHSLAFQNNYEKYLSVTVLKNFVLFKKFLFKKFLQIIIKASVADFILIIYNYFYF